MTEAIRKEDLSSSYLSAICAYGGIDFEKVHHDDDSTDVVIKKTVTLEEGRKYISTLRVQLKSTSSPGQYTDKGEYLVYKLKVKNYNDLCMEGTTAVILALLVLPEDESDWLTWTQEELLIKGCMYWASFALHQPSQNSETVSVHIDKKNVINSTTLNIIMDKIAREEWPCSIR